MVEDAGKSGEQTMDLKTWQQTDRDTSKVMMWMTKEEHPPKTSDMPNLAQKALYREWLAGKLVIIDGILRRGIVKFKLLCLKHIRKESFTNYMKNSVIWEYRKHFLRSKCAIIGLE